MPFMPQAAAGPPAIAPTRQKKGKKEKPLVKTPVPGTEWLRVLTTEGNTFYTHTADKRSVWTVPEEIKDAVEQLEREETLQKAKAAEEAGARLEEEQAREVERLQSEVKEMIGKRKAEGPVPVDEVMVTKRAKVEEEEEDEEDEDDDDEDSEEEEWQKEAAAQLAAEAEEHERMKEEEKKQQEEEAQQLKEAEKQKGVSQLNMPERVDLSPDEAKALFKVSQNVSRVMTMVGH